MNNLPKYIPVSGTKFVRDTETGAILNTDMNEMINYQIQKDAKIRERMEKEANQQKFSQIENDIKEIKDMIFQLAKMRDTNGN
jgi:hypothetical protein